MFNYDPSFEEASPRAMLIQLDGKGGDFGHIRISFVRDAVAKGMNPDTGREEYHDGPNAQGYRRTSWSSKNKNAYMIEDLVIDSQMSKDRSEGDRKPYGVELRYRDVFSIDKGMAVKMADTLVRLDKKLTKLDQEFGYASGDLATFITRVASIMGIKKFLTVKDGNGNLSDSYCYKSYKATDIEWLVNGMVDEFYGVKRD